MRLKIRLTGHVIKRFHERFLGGGCGSMGNISLEIAEILESLMSNAKPFARAQRDIIIYCADWRDPTGRTHEVYMLLNSSDKAIRGGGMIMSTVVRREWVHGGGDNKRKGYLERGAWQLIWGPGKKRGKGKK